jgi:hypothetical protein
MRPAGKEVFVFFYSCFLLFLSLVSAAQHNSSHPKFYMGMELGAGGLQLTRNSFVEDRNVRFALGLNMGYRPFHWLCLGINASGWLIEAFEYSFNPDRGISISNIYGQLKIYPIKKYNVYANLQGGWTKYINYHPDEYFAKGMGGKVDLGYDLSLWKLGGVSIAVNYGYGKFDDSIYPVNSIVKQQYDVVELLVGIEYHR